MFYCIPQRHVVARVSEDRKFGPWCMLYCFRQGHIVQYQHYTGWNRKWMCGLIKHRLLLPRYSYKGGPGFRLCSLHMTKYFWHSTCVWDVGTDLHRSFCSSCQRSLCGQNIGVWDMSFGFEFPLCIIISLPGFWCQQNMGPRDVNSGFKFMQPLVFSISWVSQNSNFDVSRVSTQRASFQAI